jgi:hypothetical protein
MKSVSFLLLTCRMIFLRLGKTYPNTSLEDAPDPPACPILRCDHGKEAHLKQSRYLTTAAHAYYFCCYKIVSIKIFSSIQLFQFSPLPC